jgi:hypothetical protein
LISAVGKAVSTAASTAARSTPAGQSVSCATGVVTVADGASGAGGVAVQDATIPPP